MIKTVQVKNVVFGEGMPKVCVPLVGKNDEAIKGELDLLKEISFDVVEWRMDHHEEVEKIDKMIQTVTMIREYLGEVPLLATFRTKKEGGERQVGEDYYVDLNKAMIVSGNIDLIDVELFTGDTLVKEIVREAHQRGIKVVMSNHDFEKTPKQEEMIKRLCKMQDLEADLPKIAVMPQCAEDVLTLLSATNEMIMQYAERPIITMAMGKLGLISRLAGGIFGSALTFGAAQTASAPGQIAASELRHILEVIHG